MTIFKPVVDENGNTNSKLEAHCKIALAPYCRSHEMYCSSV